MFKHIIYSTCFYSVKNSLAFVMLFLPIFTINLKTLFQTFSENELNSFEFKSLQDTLNEVRTELDGNNIK